MLARFFRMSVLLGGLAVIGVILPPPGGASFSTAQAQERSKRLILKDGTFQTVVKYEVQGNRVHYLSAERYEWEDIPTSLIDWDATKKYEADLASGKLAKRMEETPEEKEEREKEEANSPEIAPGMKLPGTGGVFLYDMYQGKPQLAEIVQNGTDVNKQQTGKSVLLAQINPIAGSTHNFQLKGAHATIQAHTPSPVIYIDIDEGPQNEVALENRFRIVRAELKKDKDLRTIGNLKISISGKSTESGNFLPTSVQKLGVGEWVKVTPAKELPAGEYAVVEMLGGQEINLYVWDFGVNPNAPVNPSTWQPTQSAKSPSK
jgi:hypothetical protein